MGYIIGMIATVVALILLGVAVYKGVPILIASPVCGALVLLGNGYPLLEGLTGPFMGEAADFFKDWFLFFLLGAVLGVIMERTGAAASLAKAVYGKLGARFAIPAVTAICGLLMIGGVSGFVVVFAVYPFAVELFREADIPRKYMVASIAVSCAGWGMWLPGVPMTQNVIPMEYLGTEATAGAIVGIICFVFQWGLSILYLNWSVRRDRKKGIHFESRETLNDEEKNLPSPMRAVAPLLLVFGTFALLKLDILISLLLGAVTAMLLFSRQLGGKLLETLRDGCKGATNTTINVCMIMSVAGAFQATDTFSYLVEQLINLPFDPLVSAAISVNVVCGLTASATGGITVALPALGQSFVALGADASALHRVAAISSGVLECMPHSGWLCSTQEVCRTNHRESYGPFAVICLGIGTLTLILALTLFTLFPALSAY